MNNVNRFRPTLSNPPENAGRSDRAVVTGLAQLKSCDREETILLVEDDPALREVTRELLRKHGYQVFTADSDSQTLQVWERFSHQIDLLLTDMLIPHRTTGLELAKKLKREKPTLKVVFTSGFGREIGDRDPTFESSSFLQKPYAPEALLRAIAACLEVGTEPFGQLN
jgi:CheY-like chemotaxis protein